MRLLAFLIGTLLLAALSTTIGLEEVWQTIGRASPPRFASFALVSAAVFAAYALRGSLVLRGIAAPVMPPLHTLLGFRAAAHAVNFLVPSAHLAGEPVRALLFRRTGFAWGDAFLAATVDRWIEATASAITGPICIGVFLVGSDIEPRWAAAPIAIWLAASAAMLAVYGIAARRGRLLSILARGRLEAAAEDLGALESRFADFLRTRWFPLAVLAGLVAEVLIVFELVLLLDAFDLHPPLSTVLGIMLGMGVAALAPIPAGVGSLEGAQVGVLALAGEAAALGLAVGVLIRLRETLWTAIGLVTLWHRGVAFGAVRERAAFLTES